MYYEDLSKLTNQELEKHYINYGIEEKRIPNLNKFMDFLKMEEFDINFYKKINNIDLQNNIFPEVSYYKYYLKNIEWKNIELKNVKELEKFLEAKDINFEFFENFYNLSDNIEIYKKIKNKKQNELIFFNLNQLDSYLKKKKFNINFYYSMYKKEIDSFKFKSFFLNESKKLDISNILDNPNIKKNLKKRNNFNEFKIKKHYIEIGINLNFYVNEDEYLKNNIEYQSKKKLIELENTEKIIDNKDKILNQKTNEIKNYISKVDETFNLGLNDNISKTDNSTYADNILQSMTDKIYSKNKNNITRVNELKIIHNQILEIDKIMKDKQISLIERETKLKKINSKLLEKELKIHKNNQKILEKEKMLEDKYNDLLNKKIEIERQNNELLLNQSKIKDLKLEIENRILNLKISESKLNKLEIKLNTKDKNLKELNSNICQREKNK